MLIKLVKKNGPGDNQPLVVMVNWGEEDKPKKKYIQSCNIGQALDVPDELGYAIMGQYPKCFIMVAATKEKQSAAEVK